MNALDIIKNMRIICEDVVNHVLLDYLNGDKKYWQKQFNKCIEVMDGINQVSNRYYGDNNCFRIRDLIRNSQYGDSEHIVINRRNDMHIFKANLTVMLKNFLINDHAKVWEEDNNTIINYNIYETDDYWINYDDYRNSNRFFKRWRIYAKIK